MPRRAKESPNRWLHSSYVYAYVFNRNGMAYTCVDSQKKATGYEFLPKNKRACMDLLSKRLNEILNPAPLRLSAGTATIQDLIKAFHRDRIVGAGLKAETQRHYKNLYKRYFTSNYNLSQTSEIRGMLLSVKNQNTIEGSLSNNTLWKHFQRLRKIFNYGVELELIDRNPITNSMINKYANKKVVICTEKHVRDIIDFLNNTPNKKRLAAAVELVFYTAARAQEVIDLTWYDIEKDYIRIKGKGDIDRYLPVTIHPGLKSLLERLRQYQKPVPYKATNTLFKGLRDACKSLTEINGTNYTDITLHTIRKLTINRWRSLGMPEETRNYLAGHSKDVGRKYYLTAPDIVDVSEICRRAFL